MILILNTLETVLSSILWVNQVPVLGGHAAELLMSDDGYSKVPKYLLVSEMLWALDGLHYLGCFRHFSVCMWQAGVSDT